jgi:hypothetical protein
MECDFGGCMMLKMEICQIHVRKPSLQCYGFPQKNIIIFQLRPSQFFMHYYIHHTIHMCLKNVKVKV